MAVKAFPSPVNRQVSDLWHWKSLVGQLFIRESFLDMHSHRTTIDGYLQFRWPWLQTFTSPINPPDCPYNDQFLQIKNICFVRVIIQIDHSLTYTHSYCIRRLNYPLGIVLTILYRNIFNHFQNHCLDLLNIFWYNVSCNKNCWISLDLNKWPASLTFFLWWRQLCFTTSPFTSTCVTTGDNIL